jgi:hypothetical protein
MTNPKCSARRTSGVPCKRYAVDGATVCPSHGGLVPQVARKALVRAEISKWALGDLTVDPGEVLLRMITQSVRRAEMYSALLEEAYTAAEADALVGTGPILGEQWRMPAGVAALIGHRYAIDPGGGPAQPIAEAIRGLVDLEMREREFCANLTAKAIGAGLAERTVRVQEVQAAQTHRAVIAGLDRAGVTGPLRTQVLEGMVRALRLGQGE